MDKFPVTEIFNPTIQGEGKLAGQVSGFVRFGACSFRCSWCDSMHSVDPKQIKKNAVYLDELQITDKLESLGASINSWITLTGGDPCVHELGNLVALLKGRDFRVAVETQGALYKEWLEDCDLVTCSPKGPTSGMHHKLDWRVLNKYVTKLASQLVFKIVSFGPADLDFVEEITNTFPQVPLYLTSGTIQHKEPRSAAEVAPDVLDGYKRLVDAVLARPALHHATLSPQLHVLLWGNSKGR